MDYSYIKNDVTNERNINRKRFEKEYQNQENELVLNICDRIINQVEETVKLYYSASYEVINRVCMRVMKKPTLFRRNWIYEAYAENIVVRSVSDYTSDTHVRGYVSGYDCKTPCIFVPNNKLVEFCELLNQRLQSNDMSIKLEYNDQDKWYNIKILANLGKL